MRSARQSGAGEAESNLEALNYISEALGGSADATENAEAIANIAENASGGGGSSDFSTAEVTITWDTTSPLAYENLINIGTESEDLVYLISKPISGQSVEEVVLYKGRQSFAPSNVFVKNLSGSIAFDEETENYQITGDCSFTLSETE